MEAGMEVIYSGIRRTPEQIAEVAVQEDVDVVMLSCLSGAHNTLFPRVVDLLRQKGGGDILVLGGGIIPEDDMPFLKEHGIQEVFYPGAPIKATIQYVRDNVHKEKHP